MTSRPPTVAEINAMQKSDAEQATLALQARQDAARSRALATSQNAPMAPAPIISSEALEQNLASWGGTAGTPLQFNGLDGCYQSGAGDKVDVSKTVFVAHLDETRREWIKFNGEGNPPTILSFGISEAAAFPSRAELGDLDPTKWERSRFTNEPVDKWQEQYRIPIVAQDAAGEIFELTSRSKTSLFAVRNLLNRYARHPQRRKGLVPLITLVVGTYHNSKLGADKPKSVFQIVGWTEKDGSEPAKKPDQITSGLKDFGDEIPF